MLCDRRALQSCRCRCARPAAARLAVLGAAAHQLVWPQTTGLLTLVNPRACRMNIGIVWGFFGFFAFLTWLILCIRRYERR